MSWRATLQLFYGTVVFLTCGIIVFHLRVLPMLPLPQPDGYN
jgi:hypothetical protein